MTEAGAAAEEERPLDAQQLYIEGKSAPRSLRRLPSTTRAAVALVWRAGRWRLVIVAALQVLSSVLLGLQVLFGREALAAVLRADRTGSSLRTVLLPVIGLAIITAVAGLNTPVFALQQRMLNEQVSRTSFAEILDVTESVDLLAFESAGFFDRLQRVQTNALLQPLNLVSGLLAALGGIAGVVALIVALLALTPILVPVLLIGGVPLFLIQRAGSRSEFDFAVGQTTSLRMRYYLRDVLVGRNEAKEVRAFGLQYSLRARYERLYEDYLQALARQVLIRLRLALVATVVTTAVTALTLVILLSLVLGRHVTLPDAGAAIIAIRLLTGRLQSLASGLGQLFEADLFLGDLAEFLGLRRDLAHDSRLDAPEAFEELVMDGVHFTYPGSLEPALQDVSARVRAGEVVALVGENGSGKTTLAKVLAGLYEPTTGAVLWDGVNVCAYRPESVRERVSVIFQDFVRYALPARLNVDVGDTGDGTQLLAAAVAAGADPVLSRLPYAYETVLSKEFPEGRDLSLGQWQRVALARAFYRDSPFIVLDEPSSALDPRAEDRLFQSVRTLLQGRTVLLISHRFSSARSADRILVLQAGRLVENGTHEELMRCNSTYAELFRLQAKGYLDDE